MSSFKHLLFTRVELEYMQIIWSLGEASTEDIQRSLAKHGRDVTDGGIRRILSILMKKGHVTRRREGHAFVYTATISRKQAFRAILKDIKKRVFGGSNTLMTAAFLDNLDIKDNEENEIRRLLEEHGKGGDT